MLNFMMVAEEPTCCGGTGCGGTVKQDEIQA